MALLKVICWAIILNLLVQIFVHVYECSGCAVFSYVVEVELCDNNLSLSI